MTKRRKPQVFRRETVKVTPEMAREFLNRPRVCIWQDCTNMAEGDLPPDWVNLIMYWSPTAQAHLTLGEVCMSPFCTQDAVLCAEHARELESMLKPIRPDPRLDEPSGRPS